MKEMWRGGFIRKRGSRGKASAVGEGGVFGVISHTKAMFLQMET